MKQNTQRIVTKELSLQSCLRPALPHVSANKEYHLFREQLKNIENLLVNSHLESMAMDFAIKGYEVASPSSKRARMAQGIKALRIQCLRMLLGNPSTRSLSKTLASSMLMADFCGLSEIDRIKGTSKSTLDRASKFFDADQLRWMATVLTEMISEQDRSQELGLNEPIDTSVCLVDTTCLEANIHFPVDWVLLRDVSSTLLKAIKLIRDAGLCNRMPEEPAAFAKQMSRLCIEMTHTRRKEDSKKSRKAVLRKMKPLLINIAEHARRHRDKLQSDYASTSYTKVQAQRIISRIDGMLSKVPEVIHQAHERIIGERQLPSSEKILSVHEPDVQVIVRGKAGREVEFGNTLFLSENRDGLILDWAFYRERAPSEPKQLEESLKRQLKFDISTQIESVCADRGFSSKACSKHLNDLDIYDAVCPKSPAALKERIEEVCFKELQGRRGSTEARVAIIKQKLAKRLRQRGFENRERAVGSCVLAHNLWIMARKLASQEPLGKAA